MRSGASQINFFQAPCARLGATWQRRQGGDAASTLRSEATAEDGLRRPRPRSAGGTNLGSVHSSHIRRAAARGAGRRSPSSPSSVAGLLRRMGVAALRRWTRRPCQNSCLFMIPKPLQNILFQCSLKWCKIYSARAGRWPAKPNSISGLFNLRNVNKIKFGRGTL